MMRIRVHGIPVTNPVHSTGNALLCIFFVVLMAVSCQTEEYEVDYPIGNPNHLVGNWRAFEFQGGAFDLEKLADEYDLVTALDPNSNDSLVVDNLYNSGVRVKTHYDGSFFEVSHGRQLEVIHMGQYGIYTVSVNGEFQSTEEDGDYLVMNVGLYDRYATRVDTVLIFAFRKTGFEDTDYQSLLSK
ncbi:MAG: hypothetical protein JW973_03670 [Bacteroidales bacterium]|nr:hypothetical protein [Bacteroidales bacterium]